jgi:hypothetical protein
MFKVFFLPHHEVGNYFFSFQFLGPGGIKNLHSYYEQDIKI